MGWRETGTTHLRREREGWEVKVEMCVGEISAGLAVVH